MNARHAAAAAHTLLVGEWGGVVSQPVAVKLAEE